MVGMAQAGGYFLYDLFICVAHYDQNGAAFLLHGALCCAAYWYPVLSGRLHYMGASYLMWELSTPLLYVRWVLLKRGHAKGRWMPRANAAFVLAFFACRIVYGPRELTTPAAAARGFERPAAPAAPRLTSPPPRPAPPRPWSAVMSWDFWTTTQADLARPRPGAIPAPLLYVYYAAMLTLNCLNYYWFLQMAILAAGRQPGKEFKNKAT
jgi:hypothetical protein